MPALDTYTSMLVVEVAGAKLPAESAQLLARGRVTDGVGLPDAFELEFADEAGEIAARFPIAAAVKLRLAQNGPEDDGVLFDGEVTAVEREDVSGALRTRIRGLDGASRLLRGTRVAAFVDCTVADIARKVAQTAGLTPGTIEGPSAVLPHVAQDNISDWAFLNRLARATGCVFTVTGKRLDFGPPTSAAEAPGSGSARDDPVVIEHGQNAQYVRAVVTAAEQVKEVTVRGWDPTAKDAVVSQAVAKTAGIKLSRAAPGDIAKKVGGATLLDAAGDGTATAQDARATALADRFAGGFAEVEALVLGNPAIRCGVAVTLTGFGEPFDGSYTVSETTHEFSSSQGYLTTAVVSNVSDRSLFGVAGAGAATREATTPGVVIALVSDNLDPDDAGRVKVAFPWASADYVSGWARVAQAGAGESRGAVVLPEVGDEVLVAFEHGLFDRPVVIGGLFNGKDEPRGGWKGFVDSTGVLKRSFTSRTGMCLEFVEDGSSETVQIATNDGAQHVTVRQDGGKGLEIVSEGPVAVTAKGDVTVKTDSGNIDLSGATVKVSAQQKLELSGAQLSIKGTASAELQAPQVTVKADAAAEVSAGAMLTVKGALVKIN